jgi:hypothetical protein
MKTTICAALLACALLGCGGEGAPPATESGGGTSAAPAPSEPGPSEPAPEKPPRFHAELLAAVADYEAYGWVDDIMRWAPGLCRMPTMRVRYSESEDGVTHGRKLYWLFAKDGAAYRAARQGKSQPLGQVLVKEAWRVREATAEEVAEAKELRPKKVAGLTDRFHTPVRLTVERDGTHWTPDTKQGLYVMLKLGPEADGTDAGWIYGTTTPDGKTVTSAGRVASCMRCHEKAEHDRMLGS